jgi:hypothetical protein
LQTSTDTVGEFKYSITPDRFASLTPPEEQIPPEAYESEEGLPPVTVVTCAFRGYLERKHFFARIG